jgi:hypothetical protein
MSTALESGVTDVRVPDGHFVDLYAGQPRIGTQPLQSVQFNAAAPNLVFTIDPALNYTLVIRGPGGFSMSFTPD